MLIKKFALTLKPYLYPAVIEFSISCATIFIIMWTKIGKRTNKHFSLLPTKQKFEGVGEVNMPFSNLYIMLDCTKTAKGLFFGIIVIVVTLLSSILFIIFNNGQTNEAAKTLSEITEILLLLIALVLTSMAFVIVRRHYSKVTPEANMFDIVLEIFSLFGVYAYSINSLIALFYWFANHNTSATTLENYMDFLTHWGSNKYANVSQLEASRAGETTSSTGHSSSALTDATATIAAFLSLIQCTFQTLFILECLRRYAAENSPFIRKPARELITALLLTNVSLWLFDSLSAKRFSAKPFLIEHFGILKWSIINAFSAPIAIFYRFHSSVCLSDIWYGLFYGESEHEDEHDDEYDDTDSQSIQS